jgi:TP901 family phage tail tape measure protein
MAKGNGGQINFGVGFNVDKSELNDLKKAIDQIYATKPSSIIDAKSITDARARLTEI